MKRLFLLTIIIFFYTTNTYAINIESINLSSRINSTESNSRPYCYEKTRCDTNLVNKFYIANHLTPVWIQNQKITPLALKLINKLENSASEGLYPTTYHIAQIKDMVTKLNSHQLNSESLADLELSFTNAFFSYVSNLAFGRVDNHKNYPNWIIKKRTFNLINLLNQTIATQNLESTLAIVNPKYQGYYELKTALNHYQKLAQTESFENIPTENTLKLGSKGHNVELLNKRLIATGELGNNEIESYDLYTPETKKAVAIFQSNNGLQITGVANKTTLKALNVSINKIIDKISINLDRMRWLPDNIGTNYVWVNIPNFSLNVIESNHDMLSMPIIVGKEGTKSCVLDSNIQYMELNPYWNIPRSIAVKEILPKLRENPYYLKEKGYTAYKDVIRDNTEIDSTDVDWDDVSNTNFNYVFRQKPGKTNALGNIKFIFPNDCGIYLHDTPQRNLFKNQRRAYSHGCIRIGKPIELASYLLRDKPKYTVEFIESQINSGKRKIIPLKDKEAVHIVYLTSWVNESGQLQFRPDIYNIDNSKTRKN